MPENIPAPAAETRSPWEERILAGELTLETICGWAQLPIPEELAGQAREAVPCIASFYRSVVPGTVLFADSALDDNFALNVERGIERGARCVVANEPVRGADDASFPTILCEQPFLVAADLAGVIKARYSAKTIAITGSVGKTTTKEMVRRVCATTFATKYSHGNQNGFGQTVRHAQDLEGVEVHIQETGMRLPGSIERAGRVLHPDIFAITNIGLNHVGKFGGDQMAILHEKLMLDVYAADGAVGFINWDDPLLRAATYRHRVVSYALERADVDFCARSISEGAGGITFEVVEHAGAELTPVRLNVVGRHNVANALCAFAIGVHLGVPRAAIAEALGTFSTSGVRQNLVELCGQQVYLDCYNASEGAIESVAETLEALELAEDGQRILVLADIDDKLGSRTEEVHRRVGRTLAEQHHDIDLLLCLGEHMAWAAEEAAVRGMAVRATLDHAELEGWVREVLGPHDLIAFKGGQQMMLSKSVDNLFGTAYFTLDGDVADFESVTVERGGMRYRVYRDYGAELHAMLAPCAEPEAEPEAARVPAAAAAEAEIEAETTPAAAVAAAAQAPAVAVAATPPVPARGLREDAAAARPRFSLFSRRSAKRAAAAEPAVASAVALSAPVPEPEPATPAHEAASAAPSSESAPDVPAPPDSAPAPATSAAPESIELPDAIDGVDVRVIGRNALKECTAVSISLPQRLRAIDRRAFFRAKRLRALELPDTLEYIGPYAFNTCSALRGIYIPESVRTIEERAFSFCRQLEWVIVPGTVKTIGRELFYRSPRVHVVCPKDSWVYERFAQEYPERVIGI